MGRKSNSSSGSNERNRNKSVNENIETAQRSYEEKVNEKRGLDPSGVANFVNYSIDSFSNNGNENENDNSRNNNAQNDNGNRYNDTKRGNHSQNNSENVNTNEPGKHFNANEHGKYDYTQNENIKNRQRDYDKEIEQSRGYNKGAPNFDFKNPHSRNNRSDDSSNSVGRNSQHYNNSPRLRMNDGLAASITFSSNGLGGFGNKYSSDGVSSMRSSESVLKDYHESMNNLRRILEKEKNEEPESRYTYVSETNYYRGIDPKDIESRNIDLSELYQESAYGGARNDSMSQTFGASSHDINNLLNTRGLVQNNHAIYKLSDNIHNASAVGKHYAFELVTGGSDFGQGLRVMRDFVSPVFSVIAVASLRSVHKEMRRTLASDIARHQAGVFGKNTQFIANPQLGMTKGEIAKTKRELIKALNKAGHKFNFNQSGFALQRDILKYLRKNKHKLTSNEKAALKMLLAIAKYEAMGDRLKRALRVRNLQMYTKVMRYVQQTDFGDGLRFLSNFIRRATKTIRMGIRLLRMAGLTASLAGKVALSLAKRASAAAIRSRIGRSLLNSKLGRKARVVRRRRRAQKNLKNLRKQAKILDRRNRFNNSRLGRFMDRHGAGVRRFLGDPLGLKRLRTRIVGRFNNSIVGRFANRVLSPFRFIKRMFGNLFDVLAKIRAAILTFIAEVVLTLMGFMFLAIIISSVVSTVCGVFDFSSYIESKQEAALNAIITRYEEDSNRVEELRESGEYQNFSIKETDIRDVLEYQKEENKPTPEFEESTNSAEILSMATIYFDFDLDSASKKQIKKYVTQLYNGSHLLKLVESPVWGTDEDGNQDIVAKNIEIEMVTYYFNGLFECELTDKENVEMISIGGLSGDEIIAGEFRNGDIITPPPGLGTYYTYMGWQCITSPSSLQYQLRQQAGMNFNKEGFGIINGRYVIACTSTFGRVGDYIDFYLQNGIVLKCIIGDIKNQGDKGADMWGHDHGRCMIEFVVDKTTWYRNGRGSHANPGTPTCHPEWKSSVVKAVNGGSYFSSPLGPSMTNGTTGLIKPNTSVGAGDFFGESDFPPPDWKPLMIGNLYATGQAQIKSPCPTARISSEFGPRVAPKPGASTYHKGRDYAAPTGTKMYAVADGIVKTASFSNVRGNYIVIDHGGGFETWYQHCSKINPKVKKGAKVKQGNNIALVGMTGIATGPHLHFETHVNGKPKDPRIFLFREYGSR